MSDYPPCKIYLLVECVWTLLASAEMNQKLVEDIPSSPLPQETREYVDFVPNNNKTMNKNVVYLLSDISWIFLLCSLLFVLLVGLAACGCRKYNLSVPTLDKYVDCSLRKDLHWMLLQEWSQFRYFLCLKPRSSCEVMSVETWSWLGGEELLVILIFFSLMFQLEPLYFANSAAIVSFLLQTTTDVSITKPKWKLNYIDERENVYNWH